MDLPPPDVVTVLGIETSCDETGIALYRSESNGLNSISSQLHRGTVLAERLSSQIELHRDFGGVVPEVASRDHVRKCLNLVDQTLDQAGIMPHDIDLVAYTAGPGLLGALFVGSCLARSLAFAWSRPYTRVHHMEAHLLVALLEMDSLKPPFVALLVSGGHTQLYRVEALGQYELLGETLDDAAGEAFDKVAKMLGLGYPGGPALGKLATRGRARYKLPRPMCDRPGLDFSFSGLKTATLQLVMKLQALGELDRARADVAASFQAAAIATLVFKATRAMQQTGLKNLIVAGGVSANSLLRQELSQLSSRGLTVFYPRLDWCTDNGVMIAYAGWHALQRGQVSTDHCAPIGVRARWPLFEVSSGA